MRIPYGGGKNLGATLIAPTHGAETAVLMAHGYNSDSQGYLDYGLDLVVNGVASLAIDLPGHGKSDGSRADITIGGYVGALDAAFTHLTEERGFDPDKVGILGASFSGYLAMRLTDVYPDIRGLMLRAPAIYPSGLDDVARGQLDVPANLKLLRDYRQKLTPQSDDQALYLAKEYKGNLTVVESENDESIPKQVPRAYLEAALSGPDSEGRIEYFIIPGARHSLDQAQKQLFSKHVVAWATGL